MTGIVLRHLLARNIQNVVTQLVILMVYILSDIKHFPEIHFLSVGEDLYVSWKLGTALRQCRYTAGTLTVYVFFDRCLIFRGHTLFPQ